jgi:hypothetical protein
MPRPWIDAKTMRIVKLEAADRNETLKDTFRRLIEAGASPAILKRVEEEGNAISRTIEEWKVNSPEILKGFKEEENAINRRIREWDEEDVRKG